MHLTLQHNIIKFLDYIVTATLYRIMFIFFLLITYDIPGLPFCHLLVNPNRLFGHLLYSFVLTQCF